MCVGSTDFHVIGYGGSLHNELTHRLLLLTFLTLSSTYQIVFMSHFIPIYDYNN